MPPHLPIKICRIWSNQRAVQSITNAKSVNPFCSSLISGTEFEDLDREKLYEPHPRLVPRWRQGGTNATPKSLRRCRSPSPFSLVRILSQFLRNRAGEGRRNHRRWKEKNRAGLARPERQPIPNSNSRGLVSAIDRSQINEGAFRWLAACEERMKLLSESRCVTSVGGNCRR